MSDSLNIVIIGLSITSSWGNGHATTFRALANALNNNHHKVTFLERDVPWYASKRDLPDPPYCTTILYNSVEELKEQHEQLVKFADLVILGSYVPQGVEVALWLQSTAKGVVSFYDIDTPVTLAKLSNNDYEYLRPDVIPGFDLYLSFTGGPLLHQIEKKYNAPRARPFYCSFDPDAYYPQQEPVKWQLGYLGTYSDDRQPPLKQLMLDAATLETGKNFVVAGPQYPPNILWPANVERIEHLPPSQHRAFYNSLRFTMNITRADMITAGYSPSVRLFEAAACGTVIISDYWQGIEEFFIPGKEILISRSTADTIKYLNEVSEEERTNIAHRGRRKVLEQHTAAHRATELENYYKEVTCQKPLKKKPLQA